MLLIPVARVLVVRPEVPWLRWCQIILQQDIILEQNEHGISWDDSAPVFAVGKACNSASKGFSSARPTPPHVKIQLQGGRARQHDIHYSCQHLNPFVS